MTEKELKKLNRKQLLELLLLQTQKIKDLEEKQSELELKLFERKIIEEEAGNIAEAALKLNKVFEAAQAAADQYLENIKKSVAVHSDINMNNEKENTENTEKNEHSTETGSFTPGKRTTNSYTSYRRLNTKGNKKRKL